LPGDITYAARSVKPRFRTLLALLAAVTALLCGSWASSVTKAHADRWATTFCNVTLDPAWTGIYRCDAPDNVSGYHLTWATVFTRERAGCVDYADVWHNLMNSWHCAGNWSQMSISIRQDGGWYRGVIRNNNSTYRGQFGGVVEGDGERSG
jgi:hypothetical protein